MYTVKSWDLKNNVILILHRNVVPFCVHKTMNQFSAEQLIQQQLPPAHTLAIKIDTFSARPKEEGANLSLPLSSIRIDL